MATTRLLLVRHGETTLSAEDRFAGSTNVALSDRGREQATRLGERLAIEEVVAIYSSPLDRAMETATLVGKPHDLHPVPEPGLKEIDHGRWEQMTRREVEANFGDEYATWDADPYTFAPAGGESGLSVTARVLPAIRSIILRHQGETVVLVSHKATIRLVLASMLGIDARGYRDRLDLAPASLSVLDCKDTVRARLMLYNDTAHYANWPRRAMGGLSKWW